MGGAPPVHGTRLGRTEPVYRRCVMYGGRCEGFPQDLHSPGQRSNSCRARYLPMSDFAPATAAFPAPFAPAARKVVQSK
ncbi:hypothetical protein SAMN04489731_10733 [Amycolatopsis regifaucium]|nr:hypothetical protein SAMN04489731_10733 [Amycolatopsis regifaucium]